MGGETGNLVAKTLGADDSDLIADALVGLEVEGEARVVLFNQDAGGFLDGLGSDATLYSIHPSIVRIHPSIPSKNHLPRNNGSRVMTVRTMMRY